MNKSKSVRGNFVLKIDKTGGDLINQEVPNKDMQVEKTSCFIWNSRVGVSEK